MIDLDASPARVYTTEGTWVTTIARARGGQLEVLDSRSLAQLAFYELTDVVLVCSGTGGACGDVQVKARWHATTADGAHLVVEHVSGCLCGGSAFGDAVPERLQWT